MEQIPIPLEPLSGGETPSREVIAVDAGFAILCAVRAYGSLTWHDCLRRAVGQSECRTQQAEVKKLTLETVTELRDLGLITIRWKLDGLDMTTGKPRHAVDTIHDAVKRYTRRDTDKRSIRK